MMDLYEQKLARDFGRFMERNEDSFMWEYEYGWLRRVDGPKAYSPGLSERLKRAFGQTTAEIIISNGNKKAEDTGSDALFDIYYELRKAIGHEMAQILVCG